MIRPNTSLDETDQAIKNFETIKEALKGLYEILNINISQNDIYFKLASDNIVALYHNFLDLMLNENGAKQIKKKLRNCELEADLPLGNLLVDFNKRLSF
jgi:hypothetical protein